MDQISSKIPFSSTHSIKFDLPIIVGKNKDSKRAQCVLVVPDVMRSAQELFVF